MTSVVRPDETTDAQLAGSPAAIARSEIEWYVAGLRDMLKGVPVRNFDEARDAYNAALNELGSLSAERDAAVREAAELRAALLVRVNAALALVTDCYSVHWDEAAQCVFVRTTNLRVPGE